MSTAIASPSIAGLLRGYSIELPASAADLVDAVVDRLDPGTEVSLTWIPGSNPMNLVQPAARLREAGHFPVPHIGARHLESTAQLEALAERLQEAGVDRVLIVGGDRARPSGPYDSSLAVIETGVFQSAGITRMAVAGFPEGNPHIPEQVLNEALAAKVAYARSHGLQLSIVTQFCFQATPIVEWLRRLRARGIDVPVRVGLAGPARLITLALYAVRCGIGNSLHVLAENPSFAKVLVERGPEAIIRSIAAMAEENRPPLGIAGFHFYLFGGFKKTLDWIDAERSLPLSHHR
jgi:methylenetetrahydrofolate reductase (NADPH)